MALINPADSTEVFYGVSGDVRNEFNSFQDPTTAGHYADENEIPGASIISGLRKATRFINAYLEPVYGDQIPFTSTSQVPKILDEIGSDIATYFVIRSTKAAIGKMTDEKKMAYWDQYVDPKTGMLTLMKNREMLIPELTPVAPLEAKSIRNRNRAPIFDLDDPLKQDVSPYLLDDIADDKNL